MGDELARQLQGMARDTIEGLHKIKNPSFSFQKPCPAEQWADALHDWLQITESRFLIVNTGKDADLAKHIFKGSSASRDFLITSYTFLSKLKDVIADQKFKFVVGN